MAYERNYWSDGNEVLHTHMNNLETQYEEVEDELESQEGDIPVHGSNLIEDTVNDDAIGTRTINQNVSPSSNTGKISQSLSWLGNRIKAITGKSNWYDSPDTNLASAHSHMTDYSNPHNVTQTQIGLSEVENASIEGVRTDYQKAIRAEVRTSFPSHAPGKLVYRSDLYKMFISSGSEWL